MAELRISKDGNGWLGEVEPGWSVVEDATPIAPGDSSGGTGSVSASAKANDDSPFIINARTEVEMELGTVYGRVSSATVKGLEETTTTVALGMDTLLNLLNVDRSAVPLGEGVYLVGWGSRE